MNHYFLGLPAQPPSSDDKPPAKKSRFKEGREKKGSQMSSHAGSHQRQDDIIDGKTVCLYFLFRS